MKTLKFDQDLVKKILSGEKKTTWRMFDDKDLKVGDELSLLDKSGNEFAKAIIDDIKITELDQADWKGKYESKEKMYEAYREYYGLKVTPQSILKVISFKLI